MLGANYLDHTREDADYADFDKASKAPCLFMKPCRIVAWRGSRRPCRHKPNGSCRAPEACSAFCFQCVLIRDALGALLGAVGISGDTSQKDEECAIAGIAAVNLVADTGDMT